MASIHITDGQAVAKVFVDYYLNSFRTRHGSIMEILDKQEKKVRENLTYLGFAWLKGLSEVSCYDLRNEASKLLADDICMHVRQEPVLNQIRYEEVTELDVDTGDDVQIALLLAKYLAADSRNGYQGFIKYALGTHRTLQQNLTRFFVEWFRKSKGESPFLETAGMISNRYTLAFI